MTTEPVAVAVHPGAVTVLIERAAAVAHSENYMAEIAAIHQSGGSVELRVAQDLSNDEFGGTVNVVQVVWTWAREDPHGVLHTYFDHAWTRSMVDRAISRNDHILASIIAAKVVLSSQRADITQFVKAIAQSVLVQDADEVRGSRRRAMIMAFESTDRWTSVTRSLYRPVPPRRWFWEDRRPQAWSYPSDRTPRVKRGTDFAGVVAELVGKVVDIPAFRPRDKDFTWLSMAISELFDNADRWAKSDPTGRSLVPSQRLLRLEFIVDEQSVLLRRGTGDRILKSFLERTATDPSSRHAFLEIGVLDAGPGVFARRLKTRKEDWLRAAPELQLDAIFECFVDGWTDDATASGEGRGHGWTNIFVALSKLDGFIRIRTGNLALSRDFGAEPLLDAEFSGPKLRDSGSGEGRISSYRSVVGTGITLLVPLSREPRKA